MNLCAAAFQGCPIFFQGHCAISCVRKYTQLNYMLLQVTRFFDFVFWSLIVKQAVQSCLPLCLLLYGKIPILVL